MYDVVCGVMKVDTLMTSLTPDLSHCSLPLYHTQKSVSHYLPCWEEPCQMAIVTLKLAVNHQLTAVFPWIIRDINVNQPLYLRELTATFHIFVRRLIIMNW